MLQVEEVEADYDPDFLRHIYPRLEWAALREAAHTMGARCARYLDSKEDPLLICSHMRDRH